MLTLEEIQEILDDCQCTIWGHEIFFIYGFIDEERNYLYIQAKSIRPDINDLEIVDLGSGAKEYISPYSTYDEIVKKTLKLAIAFAEHEVREGFTYQGVRLFGPHISLEAQMAIADKVSYREKMNG